MNYDVVIVGGGPAGLSAALYLGRSQKKTLLCDSGTPRNAAAEHMHGFVTRDGVAPREFRRVAREQLEPYTSVTTRDVRVDDIAREGAELRVTLEGGSVVTARRVLLTVGLVDELPSLPGVRELWGKSVFICPYCHGWEVRDRRWGVLTRDPKVVDWSLLLTSWTRDLVIFTQGAEIPEEIAERVRQAQIVIEPRPVRGLLGGAQLEAVELEDGTTIPCAALFVRPVQHPTAIVERLGLEKTEMGFVKVDERRESSVPGVHVAGDASNMFQGAIMAAAEGAFAGAMLNHLLTVEDALRPRGA